MYEFLHGAPYAICIELKYFVLEVLVCFVCDGWGGV